MSPSASAGPAEGHRPYASVLGVPLLAAAVVCLVLLALSWPTLTAKPRQLPVAVSGPPTLVQQLTGGVARSAPDAIEVVPVPDRAAAVRAIRTREAVGALLVQPRRVEVLTASAAGSGPAQLLQRLADTVRSRLAAESPARAAAVTVTDVVPLSADDPTGSRLMAASLPLALGGVLGGALLAVALRRPGALVAGLVGYGLVAGFGLGAILHYWYGALPGGYLITAVALSLALLAVASVVAGLRRLLGLPGIGLAAALFVLGAIPISGATVPREFLPQGWADLGQLLPQGAAVTLLRDLSYFPDAPTAAAWWVLAGWAAVGIVLSGLPVRRSQRSSIRAERTARTAAAR